MKLAELFKQEPPFREACRKLRAAIEVGKVAKETDAFAALQLVLDSLHTVELVMGLEERGEEGLLRSHTAGDLLSRLDHLDHEYLSEHKK